MRKGTTQEWHGMQKKSKLKAHRNTAHVKPESYSSDNNSDDDDGNNNNNNNSSNKITDVTKLEDIFAETLLQKSRCDSILTLD